MKMAKVWQNFCRSLFGKHNPQLWRFCDAQSLLATQNAGEKRCLGLAQIFHQSPQKKAVGAHFSAVFIFWAWGDAAGDVPISLFFVFCCMCCQSNKTGNLFCLSHQFVFFVLKTLRCVFFGSKELHFVGAKCPSCLYRPSSGQLHCCPIEVLLPVPLWDTGQGHWSHPT